MPKKFQGENSKAAVAKARKAEKAAEEKFRKQKEAEDEYWRDDCKQVNKKMQRKEDKERKRLEDQQKRMERKLLEEEESKQVQPVMVAKPEKVTAYQLQKNKETTKQTKEIDTVKEAQKTHLDEPLFENLNRLQEDVISASGIDAAVTALSLKDTSTPDRHPEKRMAAAYKAFEEERLPILTKENPSMRLSQLKQLVQKEWQKSPQNPIVQKRFANNMN